MRLYCRAKHFRDCARFGFLNAKMHNLPLFHLFWVSFQFLCWFLGHLVCAKLLNGNIGRAKKLAFRKSACFLKHFYSTPMGIPEILKHYYFLARVSL